MTNGVDPLLHITKPVPQNENFVKLFETQEVERKLH
jgi:hypothetical protein